MNHSLWPLKKRRPQSAASRSATFLTSVTADEEAPELDEVAVQAVLQNRVEHRVHCAMNKWIAERHPPVVLARQGTLALNLHAKFVWVGMSWDVLSGTGPPCELDILAFCLDRNGVCKSKKDVVYWGNQASTLDVLTHQDGGKPGDMETLKLSTYRAKVAGICEILIFVNIRRGRRLGQFWDQNVRSCKCSCYEKFGSRYREFASVLIEPPFGAGTTTVEVARLKRQSGAWGFHAVCNETKLTTKQLHETFGEGFNPAAPHAIKRAKGEAYAMEDYQTADAILVGFSWVSLPSRSGAATKLHVAVAMLDANGRLCKPMITGLTNKGAGVVHKCESHAAFMDDDNMDSETVEVRLSQVQWWR